MLRPNVLHSDRLRGFSKEGLWVVLGHGMAVAGSIAGVRLLTELLDPAAYGRLALGLTVATLAGQTVFGPLTNGITRYYAPAQEKGDFGGYLQAVCRLVLAASGVIVLVILLAAAGLLATGREEWVTIVAAALIFAILSGCNAILNGMQNAARKRSIVALHQGIEAWARFLIAGGLMLWLGATTPVALSGYIIAVILVLVSQLIFFKNTLFSTSIPAATQKIWLGQIWKYSFPFASWGIFSWAQLASDRWALELFASTQDVGLFAVLYQLGYYPIAIATGMVVQLLTPIFFERAGDAHDAQRLAHVDHLCRRLTWATIGVTLGVFLLTLLVHRPLFLLFASKDYVSISYLLPWMLLAGGVFAASQTISLNLMSQMKTSSMTAPKIGTALLGILCNFAGAYFYGIAGIVVAGIVFSAALFLWMARLSRPGR